MNVHNIQVACELNSTFIDKSLPSLQHKINAKEEENFWKAKKQTISTLIVGWNIYETKNNSSVFNRCLTYVYFDLKGKYLSEESSSSRTDVYNW